MHRDSATTVIERNPSVRKRRVLNIVPYCIIAIVIVFLGAMAALFGTAGRLAETGIVKSKYDSILPEPMAPARMVIVPERPVSVKFRHVIFRVGKWEICRFTYEEGVPVDARESAHE